MTVDLQSVFRCILKVEVRIPYLGLIVSEMPFAVTFCSIDSLWSDVLIEENRPVRPAGALTTPKVAPPPGGVYSFMNLRVRLPLRLIGPARSERLICRSRAASDRPCPIVTVYSQYDVAARVLLIRRGKVNQMKRVHCACWGRDTIK